MLVKNCRLIIDGIEQIKDILIENEKIVSIEDEILKKDCGEIIDAEGRYVIPGVIDPHVHMRDPGLTHKEDFTTGSMACAKGGVTTFFDMPNTVPNTITKDNLLEKKKTHIGTSYVDYGFWFGGSKTDNHNEVKEIQNDVVATKVFMNVSTGNMLVEDEKVLENIFKSSKLVGVHAEGEMVQKAISISEKTNVPVYLCHLSTEKEIEYLREAKTKGLKVYGEVTPHHLFLNEKDVEKNPLLRMKPELKTERDNEALWEGILDGTIDTIGTDHAPHRIEEKIEKLTFGIPGVENSLEMMLKAVKCDKISFEKLIKIMSENTAKIFEIKNKGKIALGYDADLVIVDMTTEEIISKDDVISKCGWTPYAGFEKGGKIVTTIVRGNVVFNDGKFVNKIGKEVI
ncbi:dihydroorotase family protein [Fusobacterium sp.]|uniref:dihydroorotase n=1 Tax=Fusobacterium sp. TaxID=68766 RepID=UPI002623D5F4|nr:dihydroorotase family protein [Fusobacterium sp.]